MSQRMQEKKKMSESEWEVMRVIWAAEELTSQQVVQVMTEKYQWQPATVKTFLSRLVKKGCLQTRTVGNKFFYQATITENEVLSDAIDVLLTHVCNTKVGQVLGSVLDKVTLSFDDITLLQKQLDQKKETAAIKLVCTCIAGQCSCNGDCK